jgi:hypothetical protein
MAAGAFFACISFIKSMYRGAGAEDDSEFTLVSIAGERDFTRVAFIMTSWEASIVVIKAFKKNIPIERKNNLMDVYTQ